MIKPLSIHSWPRAILHIDGDAFFASCEQALNPSLKGKPVVVGSERGIATAVSYEAKALGVKRGMKGYEIKKLFPECLFVPAHFKEYSVFSSRMSAIVRRYTPDVEEASIDECYADITGLQKPLKMKYVDIARSIKNDLETELGISFSIGLAPTKSIAKIASDLNKPSGLVVVPGKKIHLILDDLPVETISGVGYRMGNLLRKKGIKTVLDFATQDKYWIEEHMSKPYKRLYYELRGIPLSPVSSSKRLQKSISKTGTFYPPTSNRSFILSHLSKNVERACAKARRHGLSAKRISIFLKRQDFIYHKTEISLTSPTNTPEALLRLINQNFNQIYKSQHVYRSTGITLSNLVYGHTQPDLFGESVEAEAIKTVYQYVDALNEKFGTGTVSLLSSNNHLQKKYKTKEFLIGGLIHKGSIK